jgi:hypothetical protein
MKTRVKLIKSAVSREMVYRFARGCIERDEAECGAAAVICFEWLQRPENVDLALQLSFCFEVRTLSDRLVSSAP